MIPKIFTDRTDKDIKVRIEFDLLREVLDETAKEARRQVALAVVEEISKNEELKERLRKAALDELVKILERR